MKKPISRITIELLLLGLTTVGVAEAQQPSASSHSYGTSPKEALGLWNVSDKPGGTSVYEELAKGNIRVASRPSNGSTVTVAKEEIERVERIAQGLTQGQVGGMEMLPPPSNSTIGPIATDVPPIQASPLHITPSLNPDEVVGGMGPIGPNEIMPTPMLPESVNQGGSGCQTCNSGGGYLGGSGWGHHGGVPQRTGFFLNWDRLYTFIDQETGPFGSPRTSTAPPPSGLPDTIITGLDNDLFNQRPNFSGDRIEFGFCDGCGGNGWLGSVLFLDATRQAMLNGATIQFIDPAGELMGFADVNLDGFDDDLDADTFFGRNGQDTDADLIPDLAAATDVDDLTTIFPLFDTLNASVRTDVSGFELMRIRSIGNSLGAGGLLGNMGVLDGSSCSNGQCDANGCGGGGLKFLFGLRYLQLDERFTLATTGSFMDVNIDSDIENLIFGPQIGLLYSNNQGRFNHNASFRFMPGVNFLRGQQSTQIAGTSSGGQNEPLNPITDVNISSIQTSEQFSPVSEWRYGVSYCLTQFLSARVGYTGWYVGGVTRGANAYGFDLSDPSFSLGNDDSLFIHALTLGLDFSY